MVSMQTIFGGAQGEGGGGGGGLEPGSRLSPAHGPTLLTSANSLDRSGCAHSSGRSGRAQHLVQSVPSHLAPITCTSVLAPPHDQQI